MNAIEQGYWAEQADEPEVRIVAHFLLSRELRPYLEEAFEQAGSTSAAALS